MDNIEKLKIELLIPNGFDISPTNYELETFMPVRFITHPLHKDKVFKCTSEYLSDSIENIKYKLIEIFGIEELKTFDIKDVISHYAYCSIKTNLVTNEQICVGLFYIVKDKVIFKSSTRKMALAKLIYPNGYELAESYINQILRSLESMTLESIERESTHQNGVIHISYPKIYKGNLISDFHHLFKNVEN